MQPLQLVSLLMVPVLMQRLVLMTPPLRRLLAPSRMLLVILQPENAATTGFSIMAYMRLRCRILHRDAYRPQTLDHYPSRWEPGALFGAPDLLPVSTGRRRNVCLDKRPKSKQAFFGCAWLKRSACQARHYSGQPSSGRTTMRFPCTVTTCTDVPGGTNSPSEKTGRRTR